MNKSFVRVFVIITVQISLLATLAMSVFATEPILTEIPTSISGRVWVDINGNINPDQPDVPVVEVAVFIQRIDQSDVDAVMTLIAYTDSVGGYSLEGLEPGVYQIWTETAHDSVFLMVVTIDANTPKALVNLMLPAYRLFMPTVMR
jgi:hypothetical protein